MVHPLVRLTLRVVHGAPSTSLKQPQTFENSAKYFEVL